MILNRDMFVLGDNLLDSAITIQPLLSYNTLQNTSGFGRCILKIDDSSLINAIKGITLSIAWINAIYSDSVVLTAISVCNLLHHNTGHPACFITYPVRNIKFSTSSASS